MFSGWSDPGVDSFKNCSCRLFVRFFFPCWSEPCTGQQFSRTARFGVVVFSGWSDPGEFPRTALCLVKSQAGLTHCGKSFFQDQLMRLFISVSRDVFPRTAHEGFISKSHVEKQFAAHRNQFLPSSHHPESTDVLISSEIIDCF